MTGNLCNWWDAYRWWREAVAEIARFQWQVLQEQCGTSTRVLSNILGTAAAERVSSIPAVVPPATARTQSVVEEAIECLKNGLAPPREIYDIRNRQRVDWSQLPSWARPTDPEMFEGCAHEG